MLEMINELAEKHKSTSVYVHVDDISNLTKGKDQEEVYQRTLAWALDFHEWTQRLKLDISDKSTAVPDCWATREFAKKASEKGIPMQAVGAGVDIGVDTSSATRRTVKKQGERISACRKKARRAAFLSKRNRKCR